MLTFNADSGYALALLATRLQAQGTVKVEGGGEGEEGWERELGGLRERVRRAA